MSITEPTPELLEKVTERIQKLMSLSRKNTSEAEAAAAMEKAQALLTEYNLDMASVETAQAGTAAREKAAVAGGMYVYQRELWAAVAKLNFCMHFRQHVLENEPGTRKLRWRNKHQVVGRKINTRATIQMATYLEGVIDRLCRERLTVRSGVGVTSGELNSQFFSSWAVAFREGIADRAIEKVLERRNQALRAEHKKKAAADKAAEGVSTATTITLSHYVDKETDANIDFMWGEGTAAQWAADRAAEAAEAEALERERVQLAKDNPAEYLRREEERRKNERRRGLGRSEPARRVNGAGYYAGREAGETVGIDPQVDEQRRLR